MMKAGRELIPDRPSSVIDIYVNQLDASQQLAGMLYSTTVPESFGGIGCTAGTAGKYILGTNPQQGHPFEN